MSIAHFRQPLTLPILSSFPRVCPHVVVCFLLIFSFFLWFHWCLYSFFSNFRGVGPNALGWRMNCHTSRIHQSLSSTPSGVVDLIYGMLLVQRIGRVVDW